MIVGTCILFIALSEYCTLKKILVNKLKFYAATIKLSINDKKWKISALQLIDKQIVDYRQSDCERFAIFEKFNFS
jgi:hypothetical protein